MKTIVLGLLLYFNNPHSVPTVLHKQTFEDHATCNQAMTDLMETEMASDFTEEDAQKLWKDGDGPIFFNNDTGKPRRMLIVKCVQAVESTIKVK